LSCVKTEQKAFEKRKGCLDTKGLKGKPSRRQVEKERARAAFQARGMKGRPGADVGDVGLPLHEHLGAAKVTQLELVRLCVDQQVLGLDVPMAHLHAVDVRQRPTHLHTPQTDGHLEAMGLR